MKKLVNVLLIVSSIIVMSLLTTGVLEGDISIGKNNTFISGDQIITNIIGVQNGTDVNFTDIISSNTLEVAGNTFLAVSSGNVGIGTSKPTVVLDVVGVVNLSDGDVSISGGNFRVLGGNYIVGAPGIDVAAFIAGAALNAGLFFDATAARFKFTNTVGAASISIGAVNGHVEIGDVATTPPNNGFSVKFLEDGSDTSMRILNSAAGGSTDETSELQFQHGLAGVAGKIVSGRQGTYSSGATADSWLGFYTATNNVDMTAMNLTSDKDAIFYGNVGIGIPTPTKKLHVIGDGNISQNLTTNFIFSEINLHDDVGVVVDLVNIMEFVNISNYDSNITNGLELTDNTFFTLKITGTYMLTYSISFSGTANSEIGFDVGINSNPSNVCHSHRTLDTTSQVGNTGSSCIIRIVTDDIITLMARDEQSPVRDINVIASSMTLLRVGD